MFSEVQVYPKGEIFSISHEQALRWISQYGLFQKDCSCLILWIETIIFIIFSSVTYNQQGLTVILKDKKKKS